MPWQASCKTGGVTKSVCVSARPTSQEPIVKLPEELLALLRQPSICYISTVMADGSPQVTQTWVDTDGKHVIINSV